MICKHKHTGRNYDYVFIDNDKVSLSRPDMENAFIIPYHDWCLEYIVIDKWHKMKDRANI